MMRGKRSASSASPTSSCSTREMPPARCERSLVGRLGTGIPAADVVNQGGIAMASHVHHHRLAEAVAPRAPKVRAGTALLAHGQSAWLDFMTRELVRSG